MIWTDERTLDALHLSDRGCSASQIAIMLATDDFKPTRMAVIGLLNRVNLQTDKSEISQ